jgi:hypothetical protein
MGQIGTAFRAFFVALFNDERAKQIRAALDGGTLPKVTHVDGAPPAAKAPATAQSPPTRSEAISLLASLQREARLVDLIEEPLDSYTDEQIGGAARNVLKDARAVLDRCLGLRPLASDEEGAGVTVPVGYDPGRYRLTGNVEGNGPFPGRLAHRGWLATKVNVPTWTGSKEAAMVVAPEEVEVEGRGEG